METNFKNVVKCGYCAKEICHKISYGEYFFIEENGNELTEGIVMKDLAFDSVLDVVSLVNESKDYFIYALQVISDEVEQLGINIIDVSVRMATKDDLKLLESKRLRRDYSYLEKCSMPMVVVKFEELEEGRILY